MKKILIFFLALLPLLASAQNADRVFELFGYSKFKLGEMTLSYTSADGLLVNGAKATAAQISTVTQALLGSNSPITSGGVYSALLLQNRKLKFSLDSLSKLKADSALKASRQTIDSLITPFDATRFITVIGNKAGIDTAALHAQVKAWAAGTAYTPPVTPVTTYTTVYEKVFDNLDGFDDNYYGRIALENIDGVSKARFLENAYLFKNEISTIQPGDNLRITLSGVLGSLTNFFVNVSGQEKNGTDPDSNNEVILNFSNVTGSTLQFGAHQGASIYSFVRSIKIERINQ
ncbi:MAG: hypothetical protein EOO61_02235 [Hymenobacter sp.]|nr:MAG: hypothetical protein EOO61_02235 [Hymenobacter sp.]